jgi:hypothetical protein
MRHDNNVKMSNLGFLEGKIIGSVVDVLLLAK